MSRRFARSSALGTHPILALLVFLTGMSGTNSAVAASDPSPSSSPDGSPRVAFERLKTLVGEWRGTSAKGRTFGITYRLSAGDTVLVETWALASGRESLTLYHLDGDDLVATHYCPIGNQPRMKLKRWSGGDVLDFAFVSATNLPDPNVAHQDSFRLELIDAAHIARSETYLENGAGEPERVSYERLSPSPRSSPTPTTQEPK
jgi:hypothetical protein